MNEPGKESARGPWLRAMGGLVLPPVLALAIFAAAVGAVIVPAAEEALVERKRETLRAIVGAAISVLDRHAAEAAKRGLSPEEARRSAVADLRGLRYGDAGKDYLWIMDRDLRMVLHPYRPDLEGQSLAEFRDPAGKRVFVECLAVIEAAGAGYVEYLWQWQDDPARIEPKLSYIREFTPWGWVVGTGLYLDDVRAGLRAVTRRLYAAAGLAGAGMLLLLAVGMRQGWRAEQQRRAAERDLAESRERYRALAHASADMAILFAGGRVVGANRAACEWLGFGEHELLGRPAERILNAERDADLLRAIAAGAAAPARETLLAGRDRRVPVLLSCSPVRMGAETAVMLAGRDLRPADGTKPAAENAGLPEAAGLGRLRIAADRRLTLLAASPLAARLIGQGDSADAGETGLRDLLPEGEFSLLRHELETHPAVAGMLVRTRDGRGVRLWAAPADPATAPGALEAVVADATPELERLGAADGTALPPPFHAAPAADSGDLRVSRLRLQAWAESAVQAGVRPDLVTGPAGHVLDRLVGRACDLAGAEVGPPPAPVAFLALGSIGRGEPTLNPDQDSALLLADQVDYGDWPARFGAAVTRRLEAAGLPPCRAGHTAANPEWRLTSEGWAARFADWIRHAEPKALMEVNIFFDFRALWGGEASAAELRRRIFALVAERPVFLRHLAADTMEFRTPLDALGRIRPDHPGEDHLDLKGAMLHLVNFARIYSLRAAVSETGTVARLRALGRGGHLPPDTVADTLDAWRHLSALRLRLQVERIARGLEPENLVVLSALSPWDRATLKLALGQIGHLQQRLASEILGAA